MSWSETQELSDVKGFWCLHKFGQGLLKIENVMSKVQGITEWYTILNK